MTTDAEDRHSLDSSSLTGSLPTSRAVSPILGVGQAWRGVGPTSVPEEMKSLVQKLECPLFLRIEVLDESVCRYGFPPYPAQLLTRGVGRGRYRSCGSMGPRTRGSVELLLHIWFPIIGLHVVT